MGLPKGSIMKSTSIIKVTALSIILLGATSCMMKQDVHIDDTGGGSVVFDIALADYLTEVIDQVQTLLQPEKPLPGIDQPFFDTKAISNDLEKRNGVELMSLESPTRNSLAGEIRFDDISGIFQDIDEESAAAKLVRFEKDGAVSELTVLINRTTVEAILEENPSFNNPLVEAFGPATTEDISEENYLEMMEFLLGEESRLGIIDSALDITVRIDGRILEQKGGRIIDERTVRYSIPLLPLLMLKEPLEYTLRYE